MTPQVSDFITGLLEDTDKHIEVADTSRHGGKKGQVQIKMCGNNRDNFIATLHNVLLAPDLCDRLFYIIRLMNLRHPCLFQKEFLRCTSEPRRRMRLPCHILHIGNMNFGGR